MRNYMFCTKQKKEENRGPHKVILGDLDDVGQCLVPIRGADAKELADIATQDLCGTTSTKSHFSEPE